MPDLRVAVAAPWQSAAGLKGTDVLPWQNAAGLKSLGGTYTPGSPPVGGTPTFAGIPGAPFRLPASSVYLAPVDWELVDARDDTPLKATQVTISLSEDSVFWSIRADGMGTSIYTQLLAGAQPARVRLTSGFQTWEFVIDSVQRQRANAGKSVSFSGRSVAALSSGPFQASRNWTNGSDTTAEQIASAVMLYAAVDVDWRIDSWAVPKGAFSVTGTPLQALKALADAAGALVLAHPSEPTLLVVPRYPTMPNEWRTGGVDVDLAIDAVISEAVERAESTEYDGVYIAGNGGAVAYIRIDGTGGGKLAPFVTDPLLTGTAAFASRGRSILGGATGGQVRVPLTIPVIFEANGPGVLQPNQMIRVLDPGDVWYGLVRDVSATLRPGTVTQQATLERHLRLWQGSIAEELDLDPLFFGGPIDDQSTTVAVPFSLDVSGEWGGGTAPYTWSLRSGALPAGLALNETTGEIFGTPTTPSTLTGISIRCTDAEGGMADSNTFQIAVTAGSSVNYGVKLKFEDNVTGTPWYSQITNPGTWGDGALSVSGTGGDMNVVSSPTKYGSRATSMFFPGSGTRRRVLLSQANLNWASGTYMNAGTWFRREDDGMSVTLAVFTWTQAGDKQWEVSFGHSANFFAQINERTWDGTDYVSIGGTTSVNGPTSALNGYDHVEIEVTNTTVKLFVNGGLQGTHTFANAMGAPTCTRADLWRVASSGTYLLDEFFVYKDTAPLHSSSFTPTELP